MSLQASGLVLAWVAILLLVLAMTGLIRQVRELTATVRATATNASGSGVVGPPEESLVGARVEELDAVLSRFGRPLGLVFASAGCSNCSSRLEELGALLGTNGTNGHHPRVVVLRRTPRDAAEAEAPGMPELVDPALFEALRVTVTPSAVAIDDEGVVAGVVTLGSRAAVEEFAHVMKEL